MKTLPTVRKTALLMILNSYAFAREKGRDSAGGYRMSIGQFEGMTDRFGFDAEFIKELEIELLRLDWHLVRGRRGEYAIFPAIRVQQWPELGPKRVREYENESEESLSSFLGALKGRDPALNPLAKGSPDDQQ